MGTPAGVHKKGFAVELRLQQSRENKYIEVSENTN